MTNNINHKINSAGEPEHLPGGETAPGASETSRSIYAASQWKLIWWRFRRHKLALWAGAVLILLYSTALFAPFLSPTDPHERSLKYRQAPPQQIHFVDQEGNFHLRPFIYPLKGKINLETLQKTYTEDLERPTPIRFFVRGSSYKFLGLINTNLHFFGSGEKDVPIHLFGTDELGRDLFSRVIYGARISLSIGLIGVFMSFILGILIGGIAGFYGGKIDMFIQRVIELLRSIPHLPLWMGLSAAVPTSWPPVRTYLAITIILSILGWTGLARVVRGKFLSLREEDFVVAARLAGRSELEIIFVHLLPSFFSHIIAALTLAIPAMILGETALSFLGIGLRPPVISWGVLLKKAQTVQTVAMAPWLMIPGIFVIITVLAFNFLGDGLRDAADPYA